MRELSKKAIKFLSHQDHFHFIVEILIEIKIGAFHAKLQQRHIFGFLFSTVEEGKVICFWHLVYLVAISNRLKTEIYKVYTQGRILFWRIYQAKPRRQMIELFFLIPRNVFPFFGSFPIFQIKFGRGPFSLVSLWIPGELFRIFRNIFKNIQYF